MRQHFSFFFQRLWTGLLGLTDRFGALAGLEGRFGALARIWLGIALFIGISEWVGCDGRSVTAIKDDGTRADASVIWDSGSPDSGTDFDASTQVDAAGYWCICPGGPDPGEEDPVLQYHSCVPPLKNGCIATTCTLGQDGQCAEGYTCQQCGAAMCCICAACIPACVFTQPTQGPLPEYLKISPTRGISGEDTRVQVQGFPFYVGALGYQVRLGLNGEPLWSMSSGTCSIEVEVPSRQVGEVTSVWISSYGFGDPWYLAGFFFWQEDPYEWEGCVQPGYPCGSQNLCCETPDVPMTCQNGRCVHQ